MLKFIDTPSHFACGRTPRELALIGGGVATTVAACLHPNANPWHVAVFAVGTLLFALRFFAARVVAIGILVSAVAAHISILRYGDGWGFSHGLHWTVYPLMAAIVLLMSRDLEGRFDFAESGVGLRLNRWRDLPRSHWRAATALGWGLGCLGHFLLRAWYPMTTGAPTWPLLAIVACTACVFLLFTGRSVVFLVAAIVGIATAAAILPHVSGAEQFLAHPQALGQVSPLWRMAPGSALPAAVSALAVAAISLPYALRLLYRSLARQ